MSLPVRLRIIKDRIIVIDYSARETEDKEARR